MKRQTIRVTFAQESALRGTEALYEAGWLQELDYQGTHSLFLTIQEASELFFNLGQQDLRFEMAKV